MNIGIDIDNVISNFNEVLLSEYLIHDKELREKGIINKNAEYIRKGMFDWSEIEEENFYKENIERIARKLDLIEGAKEYINKLHEDGNTTYEQLMSLEDIISIYLDSNEEIAKIDNEGNIYSFAPGEVIFTCTSNQNKEIFDKCKIIFTIVIYTKTAE